jgi:capsular exopolysaccharide synthesis family protein
MPAIAASRAKLDLQEALREIHIMAGFDPTEQGHRPHAGRLSIGVTSPTFGDGKTTVAIALAASLSQDFEAEVTLLDADFHTHSVGREYGLQGEDGLAEVINGTLPIQSVTHRIAKARMSVVTAGKANEDPARMARSENLSSLIENMKRSNEYVVIDLPAVMHSMNAPILAKRCDAVIVVVRAGHTQQADLERVLALLKDSNVLGVVVNRHHSNIPAWVRRTLNLKD